MTRLEQTSTAPRRIGTTCQDCVDKRCAQLRSCDTEGEELEMWQDILGKIKEGVLQSFDSRVLQYEEDIRKMDAQRTTPGWNYCTFFILKEGLAQSFEHMFLLDDALIQYDELEASFFQMLRDKQLTWFTRTGGTSPGDDSANVLDLSHKDYRTLILANNISLFDFRVYLFARQAYLLTAMGKYADIAARARDYIATLARTLRNDREDTGVSFIESWVFSAAMQIIEATRKGPKSAALSAATGDLLVIARTQVRSLMTELMVVG
jgi:trafficking protein particle complex subunit 10